MSDEIDECLANPCSYLETPILDDFCLSLFPQPGFVAYPSVCRVQTGSNDRASKTLSQPLKFKSWHPENKPRAPKRKQRIYCKGSSSKHHFFKHGVVKPSGIVRIVFPTFSSVSSLPGGSKL